MSASSSIAGTLGSLFANVERLVSVADPAGVRARLGVRWGLGVPRAGATRQWTEYSWPLHAVPIPDLLVDRGGVRVTTHGPVEAADLRAWIDAGGEAIVAVDSHDLPYRPAYGRVHSGRTIVIRRAETVDEVWVDDLWTPRFAGTISWSDLERARYSGAPYDALREPLFSGSPIDGVWYSVTVAPLETRNAVQRLIGVLRCALDEALDCRCDDNVTFGLSQWPEFRHRITSVILRGGERGCDALWLRDAYLILRAELSSRVWWAALVREAGVALSDEMLSLEADLYVTRLKHMQLARDVIGKAVVRPKPEYATFVTEQLDAVARAEARLAEAVGAIVSGL